MDRDHGISIRAVAGRAKRAILTPYALRRFEVLARGGKPRRPVCLVHGNCQAEPIRALLESSDEFRDRYEAVRIPGVHEIRPAQMAKLVRVCRSATLIVAQQIKNGYRGLPLGTAEIVAAAPRACQVIRFPALYYDALHPFQVYVRLDDDRLHISIPKTFYHDVRTLCAAAKGLSAEDAVQWVSEHEPGKSALRAAADQAVAWLRHRESTTDVEVVDRMIARPDAHAHSFFAVDHPAQFVLELVARSVCEILGITPTINGEGHEPLGVLRTPLEQRVIDALRLDAEPTQDWIISGKRVSNASVIRLHLSWYRQHPDVVCRGLSEHAERIAAFDLLT